MEKKLIFLDIDGTLMKTPDRPSARVKHAVRQARANGHLAFLCTGRNMPIIDAGILAIGFDGIVASAGAHVELGGQVLLDKLMPEALVQECLEIFHGLGIFCRLETPDGIYLDQEMEALVASAHPDPANFELLRMQAELQSALPIRPYAEYDRRGAYKLSFTASGPGALRQAREQLEDRFDFVVQALRFSASCLNGEIIPRYVSKGDAVELLCRRFGATAKDAVAFGDSMNDASMLQRAGIGVAMGNSCEELKALADVVCEDVAHDGVYRQLRRMGICGAWEEDA